LDRGWGDPEAEDADDAVESACEWLARFPDETRRIAVADCARGGVCDWTRLRGFTGIGGDNERRGDELPGGLGFEVRMGEGGVLALEVMVLV
jgi:hypothetical protein